MIAEFGHPRFERPIERRLARLNADIADAQHLGRRGACRGL
jgi:hypothetical protein